MEYNSVSVGATENLAEVSISFYNEDDQGNETDSILVSMNKEVAITLMKMLQQLLHSKY